jgi:hypothetical protein
MEVTMRFQNIQKTAKSMNINTYRMKKGDIIQAIQRAENNIPCFGTERVNSCQEEQCSWRKDCMAPNNHAPSQ